MDVIGLPQDSPADSHTYIKKLISVVKMATVLEQLSLVRFFFVAKGLSAKDIHKEIFPVSGGKCLSRKAVHN
jgi:hypothetical protein